MNSKSVPTPAPPVGDGARIAAITSEYGLRCDELGHGRLHDFVRSVDFIALLDRTESAEADLNEVLEALKHSYLGFMYYNMSKHAQDVAALLKRHRMLP